MSIWDSCVGVCGILLGGGFTRCLVKSYKSYEDFLAITVLRTVTPSMYKTFEWREKKKRSNNRREEKGGVRHQDLCRAESRHTRVDIRKFSKVTVGDREVFPT